MDAPNGGFYYKVTSSGKERCNPGGLRQAIQNNTLCGDNGRNIGRRAGKVVQGQCVEAVWATREHGVRQKTPVCSRTDQGTEPDVGNRNKIVDSIPPTDRQADGTNEPEVGAILKVLYRL